MENNNLNAKGLKLNRKLAEQIVAAKATGNSCLPENSQELLHELQVHEVELELQNKELHRIQSALEDSRKRFIDLYNFAPIGYFTIDEKENILECNVMGARMLHAEIPSLIGRRFSFFVADNYKAEFHSYLNMASKSPCSLGCEILLKAQDNVEFYSHIEGIATKEINGASKEFRISIADITKHKADEKALLQSEERYRRIVETANEGMWVVDAEGKTELVNKRITEMLGCTSAELMGKKPFQFVYEDDVARAMASFERRKLGVKEHIELRFLRRDGTIIYTLLSTSPVIDDKGIFQGSLAMIIDVTERIKSEKARYQTEEKLSMALEGADIGLWDWDYKTSQIVYDPRFARMVGYETEEINPFTFSAWMRHVHPDDWPELRAAFDAHEKHETPYYETEVRIRSKTGEWLWFFIRGKIIEREQDGGPLRVAGTIMNISERKAEARQKARYVLLDALHKVDCIDACLTLGCQAVVDAGLFEQSLFVLVDEKSQLANFGFIGLPESFNETIKKASIPDRLLLKKLTRDEFRISRSFFIPREAGIETTGTILKLPSFCQLNGIETSWKNGDILCTLITGPDSGNHGGWFIHNMPNNKRRPGKEIIEYLEEIAEIVMTRIREFRLTEQLTREHQSLNDKNVTLKEVLSSIEGEKTELRKQIARVVSDILIPASKKMLRKNGSLNKSYYDLLRSNLADLADASSRMLPISYRLSPRELEISAMIKNGSSSKEIAESLDIALVTVLKHREVIRKKLGITNKAINLTTHLRNM